MPRPTSRHPTPVELDLLKVLWQIGAATVRDVQTSLEAQGRNRAYTSVMTVLNVMVQKGLVERKLQGRAYLYSAAVAQKKASRQMVRDLCARAFDNSAKQLVAQLLDATTPDADELAAIRRTIDEYQNQQRAKR